MTASPARTDVLVVGAGPAGSAAATWAARSGRDVVIADAAQFPRDKTCGDGLTPRAIAELTKLGLAEWVQGHTVNRGLRAHGFGQVLELPWPGGSLPSWGSAVARTELDDHLRTVALKAGALGVEGAKAVDARVDGGRVRSVTLMKDGKPFDIECERLIVADGVRSGLGKLLGRTWHQDTVYAVAGRCYVDSGRSDDPWISSHLEVRGDQNELLSGYGWVFPLGGGQVNVGAGSLSSTQRPARVAVKPLMARYVEQCRESFDFSGPARLPTSALLPMGGAVSGVAGPNWALVGDAAACVNPLNGEGIDYALESGRFVAEILDTDLSRTWPALLKRHYGEAFSIARRLAGIATVPGVMGAFAPAGMRSNWLMTLALRWMGNFVTDVDRDRAAQVWRWAGRRSLSLDHREPFS